MEQIKILKSLTQIDFFNSFLITSQSVYDIFKNDLYNVNILILDDKNDSESLKSLEHVSEILTYLIKNDVNKSNAVYALGGGSVGDLVGFSCSIYKRGIDFINIPTTLLACIDSAVGGKTAINFNKVKNVVGTFYPPKIVILVKNIIENFNTDLIKQGQGELFKYALLTKNISVEEIFTPTNIETIKKCIDYKQNIVAQDFLDQNLRNCLNLGHSFTHVIERNLHLAHGIAVIYGIYYEHYVLFKLNYISALTWKKIAKIFHLFDLEPIAINEINFLYYLKHDKKVTGNLIRLPFIKEIGTFDFVELDIEVFNQEVCNAFKF